jgi:hypothetical protein
VEQVAISKHGSLDALELEKQRRMQAKLEQRMQKRQAEQRQEERRHRQAAQQQQLEATMLTDQQRTAVVVAAEGGQQSIGLEGWTGGCLPACRLWELRECVLPRGLGVPQQRAMILQQIVLSAASLCKHQFMTAFGCCFALPAAAVVTVCSQQATQADVRHPFS